MPIPSFRRTRNIGTAALAVAVAAMLGASGAASAATTLSTPVGVAVDNAGQLYVANAGAGVTVYDRKHTLIGTLSAGLQNPTTVAVLSNATVLVGDNLGLVHIYGPGGQGTSELLAQVGPITSLYVDADDDLWLAGGGGLVELLTEQFGYLSSSQFLGLTVLGPSGSFVTGWSGTGGGTMAIQNRSEALRNGVGNWSNYLPRPQAIGGIAQDADGRQFVTFPGGSQVQVWSSDQSQIIATVPTPAAPGGIAVDQANERFYVTEPNANAVLVYGLRPPYQLVHTIN